MSAKGHDWANPGPAGLVALAMARFTFYAVFTGKVDHSATPLLGIWLLGGFVIQLSVGLIELKEGNTTGGNVFTFFSAFFMLVTGLELIFKFFAAVNGWKIDARIDGWAWLALGIALITWTPAYFKSPLTLMAVVIALDPAILIIALADMGVITRTLLPLEKDLFDMEYLLERPLLKAIRADKRVVLLIDEIDKTDPEFEAFLFELLSDFQVSIPELGTIKARQIPAVVLTSNGERELSDGLKRRCIYLYIDYPTVEKEARILQVKVPQARKELVYQVVQAVNFIRSQLNLKKKPSIAETLDWARALVAMHADALTPEIVGQTLNLILKNRDDQEMLKREIGLRGLVEKSLGTKGDEGTCCQCIHHHR